MHFLPALALLAPLATAIQFSSPSAGETLQRGSTVDVQWSSVDTDPEGFTIYLVNFVYWPPFYTYMSSVSTDDGTAAITIPCDITSQDGYQFNAINGTNTYIIYAQTPKFSVDDTQCSSPVIGNNPDHCEPTETKTVTVTVSRSTTTTSQFTSSTLSTTSSNTETTTTTSSNEDDGTSTTSSSDGDTPTTDKITPIYVLSPSSQTTSTTTTTRSSPHDPAPSETTSTTTSEYPYINPSSTTTQLTSTTSTGRIVGPPQYTSATTSASIGPPKCRPLKKREL